MAPSTVKLASGHEMPLVGFGLWKVPTDKAAETAIRSGYRLFDGAYDYQNEKEAGQGIQRAIKEGPVKQHALAFAQSQNEAWGLGYIDLYLIYFPVALSSLRNDAILYAWWMDDQGTVKPANILIRETWEALEEVVDRGIAKSIGVSNFQAQSLYDVQRYSRHPISSLQIEHHPYLVQPDLIAMAQENNIAVAAYTSFGPQSFKELPGIFSKRAHGAKPLLESSLIEGIAGKYGKTPAQVLLR
ncbi:NAD(P)H-dependent D-xylose reductase xyl1 [Fusarium agapanthi]|uniref:NAD(P)H-dependent D-xylose reductase xyl1 n=1 Tax=Fusarium agapanthi TaxID=1803897 RepID=A0A9P5B520_9HYPO|nr:NAD(P)H-dependent D-xylose reductase xyl1 [Fusarium agapanthi]